MKRIKRNRIKEDENIIELQNRLNQEFPYKNELTTKKSRLTQVNKMIKEKMLETEKRQNEEKTKGNRAAEPQNSQVTSPQKISTSEAEKETVYALGR